MTTFRPKTNVLPAGTPVRNGTREVSREYFSSSELCYPAVICLSIGASEGPVYTNNRQTNETEAKDARWVHRLLWQNYISSNPRILALGEKAGMDVEEITQEIYDVVCECMNSALVEEASEPWPGFKFREPFEKDYSKNPRDENSKAHIFADIFPIVQKHKAAVKGLMAERDKTPETQALAEQIAAKAASMGSDEGAADSVPF